MKISKTGRKNFVIFSLVLMLGLIGYVNYNLNKQSLLQTSSELEEYRMTMLEESGMLFEDGEDLLGEETEEVHASEVEDDIKDIAEYESDGTQVVDSREYNKVVDLVKETNSQIAENITNRGSMVSDIYFIESKLERDKKRSEMISELNDIINNQLTSAEMRDEAQGLKLGMISNTEKEILIENMVMAKGFDDAIVYLTDKSINVVVNSDALADKDVAQILDIIRRETDVAMDNITIMNKK